MTQEFELLSNLSYRLSLAKITSDSSMTENVFTETQLSVGDTLKMLSSLVVHDTSTLVIGKLFFSLRIRVFKTVSHPW